MIVKVQAAIASSAGEAQVLIYNKDRSVEWDGDNPSIFNEIWNRVHRGELRQPKCYYFSVLEDTIVQLLYPLDETEWPKDW